MPELATTLSVSEDDRLAQAEDLVREYVGWHIAPLRTSVEVVVDGSGTQVLNLPTLLLVDVIEIVEDGVAVSVDDVQWSDAGYLWRASPWTSKMRGVTVTISHGYSPIPADVQGIVQAVAQRAVNNPGSAVRVQDGPFSETYSQTGFNQSIPLALLDSERVTLDRYRLPSLA